VLDMIAQFLGMEPPEEARSTNEAAISWLAAMFQAAGQKPAAAAETAAEEPPVEASTEEDKDDEKLPEGADQIIASVNGARRSVLNGFVGYPGISAQQVGKWIGQYATCRSFKKQVRTREAFDSLVEGLRCSVNGRTNVLNPASGRQLPNGQDKVEIPGFEKLMALRKK
jgi:hypothetical protein